jgi:hypothetical protein
MDPYLLQPNTQVVIDQPAVPPNCANDVVFTYPQPSTLNYCCRPNTMLYGTAPYKAGKGAPNDLVMVEDELRPQSTTQFGKVYVNNTSGGYFPIQDMKCSIPLRVQEFEPVSTRAQVQNGLFNKRYCKK